MKTVKVPTCWTPEQADSVHRFIQAIQENIWRTYNDELQEHYRKINGISIKSDITDNKETNEYPDFDENMPF